MTEPPAVSPDTIRSWFAKEIPERWLDGPPHADVDRDEVVVVVTLPRPDTDPEVAGDAEANEQQAILEFRESTREARVEIATRAEALYRRQVSWVARCGDTTVPFTTLSVPVMTRLRMEQRVVLDTLIAAGVARSRSEAVSWCVQLVGRHEDDWLRELRDAIDRVDELRHRGPAPRTR
jgi:hypothetical protein